MDHAVDSNQVPLNAESTQPLHPAVQRVADALAAHGIVDRVQVLAEATHTSQAAADYLGCNVAQIAKSVIFRAAQSGRCVLVIASGKNRVNEKLVAAALGEPLGKADADFVRTKTGFVIGGVAPVGHLEPPATFIDADLLQFPEIWAAAGMPNTLFRLTPDELKKIAPGPVLAIC